MLIQMKWMQMNIIVEKKHLVNCGKIQPKIFLFCLRSDPLALP